MAKSVAHILTSWGRTSIGTQGGRPAPDPRIVGAFARRLQESMTRQIADRSEELVEPRVVVAAAHPRVAMRRAKRHHSTRTAALVGSSEENQKTRREFLDAIEAG